MTDAAIDALATYRLTRLVVTDSFPPVQRARFALLRRWPEDSWQNELLGCPWCLSFWIGVGVVLGRHSRLWRRLLGPALAASAVSGMLAERYG